MGGEDGEIFDFFLSWMTSGLPTQPSKFQGLCEALSEDLSGAFLSF